MEESDREGIRRRGAAAYKAGVGFDDNPFYYSTAPLDEWIEICSAWGEGWLREDAGRDEAMRARMRVPLW